jgi:dephospho-CoA kinase
MIRIALVGDIGSGKSYVAKNFGYPVFNADIEVGKLYKKNKKIFNKLKKFLPKHFYSFPVDKNEVSNAILSNNNNLKKIVKIVHLEIRKKMKIFLKKNKNKKIVILDIPLLLENKINKKNDILVFVQSKKLDILKRLKKRTNFNHRLLNKFKKIQLSLDYKKKKSQFIIKNNFTNKSVKKDIKNILKEIL